MNAKTRVAVERRARKMVRELFRKLPANMPVRLAIGDCSGNLALCDIESKGGQRWFQITLSEEVAVLPWHQIRQWVVHEYAHALAWTERHPNLQDHGPLWGVAYALVYTQAMRGT